MKGDAEVIEVLNEVLTSELTAINQYFIHHKLCTNWGYGKLSAKKREESLEEMRHADAVIDRILFLDGTPNMQRLFPVKVGEEPVEMHKVDLELELEAVARLNRGVKLAREKGDNGTRELLERILIDEEDALERILIDEEDAIDWLETQLHLIKDIGRERYLAEQLG